MGSKANKSNPFESIFYKQMYVNGSNCFESISSTRSLSPFSNTLRINYLISYALVSIGCERSTGMVTKESNRSGGVLNWNKTEFLLSKVIPFYLTCRICQNMIGHQFFIKILFLKWLQYPKFTIKNILTNKPSFLTKHVIHLSPLN